MKTSETKGVKALMLQHYLLSHSLFLLPAEQTVLSASLSVLDGK